MSDKLRFVVGLRKGPVAAASGKLKFAGHRFGVFICSMCDCDARWLRYEGKTAIAGHSA
jgi:hypothetical protein